MPQGHASLALTGVACSGMRMQPGQPDDVEDGGHGHPLWRRQGRHNGRPQAALRARAREAHAQARAGEGAIPLGIPSGQDVAPGASAAAGSVWKQAWRGEGGHEGMLECAAQAIKDVIGPQEDIPAPDMNTGAVWPLSLAICSFLGCCCSCFRRICSRPVCPAAQHPHRCACACAQTRA